MCREGVHDASDFAWQMQLRYSWNDTVDDAVVRQANARSAKADSANSTHRKCCSLKCHLGSCKHIKHGIVLVQQQSIMPHEWLTALAWHQVQVLLCSAALTHVDSCKPILCCWQVHLWV